MLHYIYKNKTIHIVIKNCLKNKMIFNTITYHAWTGYK